jgi:hypothetical protein
MDSPGYIEWSQVRSNSEIAEFPFRIISAQRIETHEVYSMFLWFTWFLTSSKSKMSTS